MCLAMIEEIAGAWWFRTFLPRDAELLGGKVRDNLRIFNVDWHPDSPRDRLTRIPMMPLRPRVSAGVGVSWVQGRPGVIPRGGGGHSPL